MELSNFLLLILLILIAKGWTIVRKTLSAQGATKLTVYATAYLLLLVTARTLSYHLYEASRSTVFYYASTFGLLALLTRCVVGGAWFSYAVHTTVRNYGAKKGFYRKFLATALAWIVAPAFCVLITITLSQFDWTIFGVVWENTLLLLAQLTLLVMYDPIAHDYNHKFPFHYQTSETLSSTLWDTGAVDDTAVLAAKDDLDGAKAAGSAGAAAGREPPRFKSRKDSSSAAAGAAGGGDGDATAGGASSCSVPLGPGSAVMHSFNNTSSTNRHHLSVADIYSDVKGQASAIVYIVNSLKPKIDLFSELLQDWDVEEDDGKED
jgi:hypothetical protein